MDIPIDRSYSDNHVWIKSEADFFRLGITEFASKELGGANYIELPEPQSLILADTTFGIIETSKAAVEIVSPITGTVLNVNILVIDDPELVISDSYERGWLITILPQDNKFLKDLFTAEYYKKLITPELDI